MTRSCPALPHRTVTAVVMRSVRGGYALTVAHYHDGDLSSCDSEHYESLTWEELQDVLDACLEERRPGTHPGGWEQLSLLSPPQHSSRSL